MVRLASNDDISWFKDRSRDKIIKIDRLSGKPQTQDSLFIWITFSAEAKQIKWLRMLLSTIVIPFLSSEEEKCQTERACILHYLALYV